MIACFDTDVLVLGIQGKANPGNERAVDHARALIAGLEGSNSTLLITATSLAEYLIGIAPENRDAVLQRFRARFRVAPFDAKAAWVAASLWVEYKSAVQADPGKQVGCVPGRRSAIKADCQIVATAVARSAGVLYSQDDRMKTWAVLPSCGTLQIEKVPDVAVQQALL